MKENVEPTVKGRSGHTPQGSPTRLSTRRYHSTDGDLECPYTRHDTVSLDKDNGEQNFNDSGPFGPRSPVKGRSGVQPKVSSW